MPEDQPRGFIIVLKDETTSEQVDEFANKLESQGGKVTNKENKGIMKTVSAQISETQLQQLKSLEGGIIDYVEPDQTVTIQ